MHDDFSLIGLSSKNGLDVADQVWRFCIIKVHDSIVLIFTFSIICKTYYKHRLHYFEGDTLKEHHFHCLNLILVNLQGAHSSGRMEMSHQFMILKMYLQVLSIHKKFLIKRKKGHQLVMTGKYLSLLLLHLKILFALMTVMK